MRLIRPTREGLGRVKGLREGLMSVGRGDRGAVVGSSPGRRVKVREGTALVFLSPGSRTIRWSC
jgi:hypothetical protein